MEKQYHVYHSIGVHQFTETELQHRIYAGYVHASSLEKAFEYAQNDYVDWCFNHTRSTSVGDIIQDDDKFYMVTGTGFKLLNELSQDDLKNECDLNSFENQPTE